MAKIQNKGNDYIVIASHPDDEILWFSSLLKEAAHIFVCFGASPNNPKLSLSREKLKEDFPLNNVTWLDVDETGSLLLANWNHPILTEFGMQLKYSNYKYEKNYLILKEKIEKKLNEFDSISRIFTHNPWGEYGHEEHVQTFQVVRQIAKKRSIDLFVTGYFSSRNERLVHRLDLVAKSNIILTPDYELSKNIMQHYKMYDAWTWNDDYSWPDQEIFYDFGFEFPYPRIVGKNYCSYLMNHINLNEPRTLLEKLKKILSKMKRKLLG